ncbi:ferredoxin [Mycolicibacterium thermoresistibile]
MSTGRTFRLAAHAEYCAGSGKCVSSAPHLFKLDEAGWVRVLDHEPPMDELDAARSAHDACPLGLIEVLDDDGHSLA